MRAICGAIITAGALIGLGLTALGFGQRFENMKEVHGSGAFEGTYVGVPSLMLILCVLILSVFIGLAVAFIGLAYHHHRRHHEWLREHGSATHTPHAPV